MKAAHSEYEFMNCRALIQIKPEGGDWIAWWRRPGTGEAVLDADKLWTSADAQAWADARHAAAISHLVEEAKAHAENPSDVERALNGIGHYAAALLADAEARPTDY